MTDEVKRPRHYNSRRWRRLASALLRANPLCACGRLATQIDHIRPLSAGGTDDLDNLQALCLSCHGRKTALGQ